MTFEPLCEKRKEQEEKKEEEKGSRRGKDKEEGEKVGGGGSVDKQSKSKVPSEVTECMCVLTVSTYMCT